MIIVLAALQLTSNDMHSEFKRRSARVVRPTHGGRPGGAVTFGTLPEGSTLQTMQFNDRRTQVTTGFSLSMPEQKPNVSVSESESNSSLQENESREKEKGREIV